MAAIYDVLKLVTSDFSGSLSQLNSQSLVNAISLFRLKIKPQKHWQVQVHVQAHTQVQEADWEITGEEFPECITVTSIINHPPKLDQKQDL